MDPRTIVPASAAIVFVLFLVWKLRPAREGRGPIDPRIKDVRARAAASTGAERAKALCEAGAIADEARRPTAAFGYYLRAARADPSAEAPIRGLSRALARKPRSLEQALWRHLASLDVKAHPEAARAAVEELSALYRRRRDRARARALENVLAALPGPSYPRA
jgi:hypothetical protein